MKQFIRPILIVFLFGLYPFPAFAQESYTIDSVAIATSPAETVNDLLKYALGVDVRQRGAMGMQTDISIRGGTYNQVAVLLDGINITDPQTGHNSFDFPVNLGDIERIEVLEGPAARVYGTSSLLGAVNIVTRKSSGNAVSASLEGGSFRSLGATVSGEIGHRGGFNSISAGYQRSDGFNRNAAGGLNTDFGAFKAFWHGSHDFGRRDLSWQAGVSRKDFGSSTFYSASFDDQFEHTRLNTFGQEANLTLSFPALLDRPAFFLRVGYTHQSQDKALEPGIRSIYSLEYIRHKIVVQADLRFRENLGSISPGATSTGTPVPPCSRPTPCSTPSSTMISPA